MPFSPRTPQTDEPAASYPLTAMQEGMLYRHAVDPAGIADTEQAILLIDAAVDASRLRAAFLIAVMRHPALRTSFQWVGRDRPLQTVAHAVPTYLLIEDHGEMDLADRECIVAACARHERERGFDLSAAPLQRFLLLRFGAAPATLIWTNHHAILDGTARGVVLRDVFAVYAGLAPPPKGADYADTVTTLTRRTFRADEPFWRARLRGYDTVPALPERSAGAKTAGGRQFASVSCTLDRTASAQIAEAARRRGLRLTSLVHAAWATVLSAYSGCEDVVFGTVRAGRDREGGNAETVGLCINTVPLRVRVDPTVSLDDLLCSIGAQWNGLRAFEQTPLPLIRSWSDLPPGIPLFETAVVVERQRFADRVRAIPGARSLGVIDAEIVHQPSMPLMLTATDGSSIDLSLNYDAGRFGDVTMLRMLSHVERALRSIATLQHARVSDLSLAAPGERQHIVRAFNTETPYPRDATIPELFARCAQHRPHAIALQLGTETVTYGALAERSDRFSRALRARGAGPGSVIGLSVERSFAMLVALLGIVKCGAASVALDPSHPPARIAELVRDAQVLAVVASENAEPAFADAGVRVYPVDELLAGDDTGAGEQTDEPRMGPLDAVHVMYTSGSTGEPKGAVIPHRAVVRTVCGTSYLQTGPDAVFFGFVPLTFDVSILEIWGALLNGGRLVLCPPGLPSLDELGTAIARGGVTTLWLTTAVFEQMAAAHAHHLRGVRQLIVGGDVMPPAAAERILAAVPGLQLLNVYGPTEATVLITAHKVTTPVRVPIPLGRPIANARVYVLDRTLNPVPIGVPGEIYTGDDGLALGYLHRPDLTAERFVSDPFCGTPGARMYRTGDIARWNPDGSLAFIGRADAQVKLSGMRVEPGAIEALLAADPSVAQAVTVVREHGGKKRLVAFVTAASAAQPDPAALARRLAEHLPATMLPTAIVPLAAMPLTPTGKIDRGALPATLPETSNERARPDGAIEETIAMHFAETLGIAAPARDDNFFELGGDSLLAMRVTAHLRESFGADLSVRAFADAPTIVGVAATVATLVCRPSERADISIRTLRATGAKAPLFFVHGDLAGGGRYSDALARTLDPERPVHVIDAGDVGERPGATIPAIARAALARMRAVQRHGPYALGGFCNGGLIAYEMARLLEQRGETVERVVLIEAFAVNAGTTWYEALRARARVARSRIVRALQRNRGETLTGDAPTWQDRHARRIARWGEAIERYFPHRYSGPLSVLWSDESRPNAEFLTRQWRRVAPHTAAAFVPGTHLSTIAGRFSETAHIFARHLELTEDHSS